MLPTLHRGLYCTAPLILHTPDVQPWGAEQHLGTLGLYEREARPFYLNKGQSKGLHS